jgi:glycosyltransferase involved in cell wall biosynthesis
MTNPAPGQAGVSILILTKNEEQNLPDCLATFAWADDVVVLDSGSTDRTVAIAEAAGARVFHRPFDDWSSHQNWAVANIPFRHPWVYYSDADERMTEDLRQELQTIAADPATPCAAYRVRFRNLFMGRWIRRVSMYPVWVLRFFRPERVRWERVVNPVAVVDGEVGRLQGHFDHHSFHKGFTEWVAKHNGYATGEALELVRLRAQPGAWGELLVRDPARRRQALKRLAYRLPGRPAAVFLLLYILRLGFLDGRAGLHYCLLRAYYEYLIDLKVMEMDRRKQGLSL